MSAVVVTKVFQLLVQCRARMLVVNLWMGLQLRFQPPVPGVKRSAKGRIAKEEGQQRRVLRGERSIVGRKAQPHQRR